MQVEAGVLVEQDADAVIAGAGAAVRELRQQVGGAAVPIHPFDGTALGADGARRCSKSRSSALSARISAVLAAVSYSIRYSDIWTLMINSGL
ncbi:hypothetical protein [Spongiactinospora rosea]|uniref:hypothetical protein n=1 Tax=Spongiactinospora rosea TaxID=2248750 RepID=UPI001CEDC5AA|nr:hypothetical protein [Spongiactinospora rosea]